MRLVETDAMMVRSASTPVGMITGALGLGLRVGPLEYGSFAVRIGQGAWCAISMGLRCNHRYLTITSGLEQIGVVVIMFLVCHSQDVGGS